MESACQYYRPSSIIYLLSYTVSEIWQIGSIFAVDSTAVVPVFNALVGVNP